MYLKKTFFISIFISIILLQGCFHASEQNLDGTDRDASGTTIVQPPSPATESRREQKKPPSFEDGQLYLQAVATGDVTLCLKIADQKLKTRCQTEVKPVKN